ncbi:hypothetical protein BDQ94DRAFT_172772 [Aspergillus welwitschiae]|uniref:PPPDE domain-containing protein n=1 Tax=Aspergillus welwitschiae TaxID=1341132 RepID=A0A3F3PWK7_9EURO|nr:hypothetical protein BDQ94DRAFT_172772 [Aspergillus welwitschiae]RDH30696.1 hypothetical protein BDQ94DRAFT_172772 [Aspergillus welwitschiae]
MTLSWALTFLTPCSGRGGYTKPQGTFEPQPVPAYQANRQRQNKSIIPDGPSSISADSRDMYLVTRILGGAALNGMVGEVGKHSMNFLKANTALGIAFASNNAPDPTQHWGVLVGDYVHQLGLDNGYNYYTNERYGNYAGWTKYHIGVTRFNDIAIRNAGKNSIILFPALTISFTSWHKSLLSKLIIFTGMNVMNEIPEVYHLTENNCQHVATRLLDKVLRDGRKRLKGINGRFMSDDSPSTESSDQIPPPIDHSEGREGEYISVNDKDNLVAYVYDDEAHTKKLVEAVHVMVTNTKTMKVEPPASSS